MGCGSTQSGGYDKGIRKGTGSSSLKIGVSRLATVPVSEPFLQRVKSRVRGEAALAFEHEASAAQNFERVENKSNCVIQCGRIKGWSTLVRGSIVSDSDPQDINATVIT